MDEDHEPWLDPIRWYPRQKTKPMTTTLGERRICPVCRGARKVPVVTMPPPAARWCPACHGVGAVEEPVAEKLTP